MTKAREYNDPLTYPTACIHQPYAGLIWLAGMGELGADIVIRPKHMRYRGPLAIAASRRIDPEAYQRVQRILVGGGIMRLPDYEAACGRDFEGKTVALVDLKDCQRMTAQHIKRSFVAPAFDMRAHFAWIADTIVALQPFNTTGVQAFFQTQRVLVDVAKRRETTRAQRDATWKAILARSKDATCACGTPFPKHIAEFMNLDPRASHVCRCGVEYVVKRGKFVAKQQNGAVANGA